MKKIIFPASLASSLFIIIALSACQSQGANSATPVQTESPTPQPENTLVVCLAQEPETLHPLIPHSASQPILDAIYDGPIDKLNTGYAPVILMGIPTLTDGSAIIQANLVSEGATIVETHGYVTPLTPGIEYRPAGCQSDDCSRTYSGGEVEMDQVIVTYTLRPDITWADGTPLTAQDSEFSYSLRKSPNTSVEQFLIERTATYEAIAPYSAIWTGIPGYLDNAYMTHFFLPMPQHLWGQDTPIALLSREDANRAPLGWGPYRVDSWNPGRSITLSKNPHYFRAPEGLPYFDTIVFRFIGQNSATALAMLKTHECDILDPSIMLEDQLEEMLSMHAAGQIKMSSMVGPAWEHLDFGIRHISYDDGYQAGADRPAFFNDTRTRQAIAHCIDRQAIVDAVTQGKSAVLNTYLSSIHPLYNANVNTYTHDPDTGRQLLENIGWILGEDGVRIAQDVDAVPDGTRFSITYWTNDNAPRQQTAEIIQANLAACGIEIKIEFSIVEELFANMPAGPLFGRQYDLAQFNWFTGEKPPCNLFTSDTIPGPPEIIQSEVPWLLNALSDAANLNQAAFPLDWYGWNLSGYANPAYDTACYTALNSLPGQVNYLKYHLTAQAIFAEDLPALPLYSNLTLAATRADFCGLMLDPIATSAMWNVETFGDGAWCK